MRSWDLFGGALESWLEGQESSLGGQAGEVGENTSSRARGVEREGVGQGNQKVESTGLGTSSLVK